MRHGTVAIREQTKAYLSVGANEGLRVPHHECARDGFVSRRAGSLLTARLIGHCGVLGSAEVARRTQHWCQCEYRKHTQAPNAAEKKAQPSHGHARPTPWPSMP